MPAPRRDSCCRPSMSGSGSWRLHRLQRRHRSPQFIVECGFARPAANQELNLHILLPAAGAAARLRTRWRRHHLDHHCRSYAAWADLTRVDQELIKRRALIKIRGGRASNREGGRRSSSEPVAFSADRNHLERRQSTRRQHHRSPGIHRSRSCSRCRSQGSCHRSAHCRLGHGGSHPRIEKHDRHGRSQPWNVGPLHGQLLHVWRLHDYLDGWTLTHSSPLARNRAPQQQRER
jgi:hypothetical protein